jgi:type IV pilus assembly protein PilW
MTPNRNVPRDPRLSRGVTLIELMVSIVLGLIVSGAALALFMTNKQTYAASESLGRIEESQRTAFEMMSRDIREAAASQCEKLTIPVDGLTVATPAQWWRTWDNGLRGYGATTAFPDDAFGTAKFKRVNGTAAIELKSVAQTATMVKTLMPTTAAVLTVNATTGITSGDLLVVCEFGDAPAPHPGHADLFQVTGLTANTLSHTASGSPGNVAGTLASGIVYSPGAVVGTWRATRWYIGYNGRTYNGQPSRSLYETTIRNAAGVPGPVINEVAQGVRDMQLTYLMSGGTDYVDATAVTDWPNVVAVNINMTMEGEDKVSTNQSVLTRSLQHIVALRNRAP